MAALGMHGTLSLKTIDHPNLAEAAFHEIIHKCSERESRGGISIL